MAENPDTNGEALTHTPSTPRADDPFLAPHAIVQAVPSTITPTTVYRPQNVRPASPTGEGAEATETREPTALVQPTDTVPDTGDAQESPELVEPTAPGTTTPEAPTPPTTPAQPTPEPEEQEPQPDGTTEPTDAGAPAETAGLATPADDATEPGETVAETASPAAADLPTSEQTDQADQAGQAEQEPRVPGHRTETPEIEPTTVTEDGSGWWIFGRWFPASS